MRGPRRIQHWAEKHVFNTSMRFWLRRGWAPDCYALVETTGRRSGQRRLTPIAGSLDGDTYWLVAEHGLAAAYVKNLTAEPRVRVKLGRQWRTGSAACLPDDDATVRREWIDQRNGMVGRLDGIVFRAFATAPLTVQIDLER